MIKKAVLLSTFLILGGLACGGKKTDTTSQEKAIAVTVGLAANRDLTIKSIYTGTLEGEKQAQIFASIPEAVVELPIPEGSSVKSGQAVILLDKSGTYSQYNQARAVYSDSRDNFEKMKKLFEQGAVSEQAFNSVRTAYEVASANYTSAKQQVELTSPIDGILTGLAVNIGEFAPVGISLATVAQTKTMRMTLYVDAASAANIKIGDVADINVETLGAGSPEYQGIVTEVSKSADQATRLFKIELKINNAGGKIRPGTFARAILNVARLNSALTVPKESLFSVEGVQKVFLLSGSRAREKTVTIGESTRDFVQILTGLTAGDSVIVIGRNMVEDGSLVKLTVENDDAIEDSAKTGTGAEG